MPRVHRARVDAVRFGRGIRALRRRRGWRQLDLAIRAGVSRSVIARVEQGRADRLPLMTLDRITRPLDARVMCRLEWHGENLDRLLDAQHARLVEQIVRRLTATGWACATEVSFSVFGERGSIDVFGYHAERQIALVVEAKSVIADVGGTLMTLDRKLRLAPRIARERGWMCRSTARLLAIADSGTARRRITQHRATFDAAFPMRGHEVTRWLQNPSGAASSLWFLPDDRQEVTTPRSRTRGRAAHARAAS
jgi:transcriptional regulator with XRE-family HTH domain